MQEPSPTLPQASRPERLRREWIEAEEKLHTEDAKHHEEHAPDTNRSDRLWTKTTDHADVDDLHGEPAHLSDHDRDRERNHCPRFASDWTRQGRSRPGVGRRGGVNCHGSLPGTAGGLVSLRSRQSGLPPEHEAFDPGDASQIVVDDSDHQHHQSDEAD